MNTTSFPINTSHYTQQTFAPTAGNSPTLVLTYAGQTVFSRSFAPDLTSALGQSEIGPIANTPLAANNIIAFATWPIGAQFSDFSANGDSPGFGATFNLPSEAQLYARDPEEFASFFDGGDPSTLPLDVTAIREQLYGYDNVLLYSIEPQGLPQLSTYSTDPITQLTQWNSFGPTASLPDALSLLSPIEHPKPNSNCNPVVSKNGCPPPQNTNTAIIEQITTGALFGDWTPTGSAGRPYPTIGYPSSSIKAVKIQRAGGCTNEQFFTDYFGGTAGIGGINIGGTSGILQTAVNNLCSSVDEFLIHNLTIVPLMRHAPGGKATDARAQIFFNASVHSQGGGVGCNYVGSALYDLLLDQNGALLLQIAVDPVSQNVMLNLTDSGGGCGDVDLPTTFVILAEGGYNRALDFFLATLPGAFNLAARRATSFPSSALLAAYPKLAEVSGDFQDCQPGASDTSPAPNAELVGGAVSAGGVYFGQGAATDTGFCFQARQDLCNLIRLGFTLSGFDPSGNYQGNGAKQNFDSMNLFDERNPGCPSLTTLTNLDGDEMYLQRLLSAIEDEFDGLLTYWRCEEDNHSCSFNPPIKRLIMNPDGIQFVLFEPAPPTDASDPSIPYQEWDNASFAFWYAYQGISAIAQALNYTVPPPLCNYTPGQNTSANASTLSTDKVNYPFTRPFVWLLADRLHCPRQSGGQCAYMGDPWYPEIGGRPFIPCPGTELWQGQEIGAVIDWEGDLFQLYCPPTQPTTQVPDPAQWLYSQGAWGPPYQDRQQWVYNCIV